MRRHGQSEFLVCGLMSGTSLDGIDAALVRLRLARTGVAIRRVAFHHQPFPRGLRAMLLKNSMREGSNVEDIARLNVFHGELAAEAVRNVARKGRKSLARIDLIGSHGQTICHLPTPKRFLGRTIAATLQIGDPSVIATRTGILTVGDFRVADVAAGGQGAPLVPYFDWLVFRSRTRNRMVLNIGGIANATLLPPACGQDEVLAFDTGPGNMVVDALMQRFFGRPLDRNGATALSGEVDGSLLAWAMKNGYFRRPLPKSAGREEFGERFVSALLRRARKARKPNVVATASLITPLAVYDAWRRYAKSPQEIDDLIISGGGAKNRAFVLALKELFGREAVKTTDEFGIPSQEKEAICFAVLAAETLAGRAANLPSVTGAGRRVVLGKICRP